MLLYVAGAPAIKLVNIAQFYVVAKEYDLECVAYGYPKATVRWKWFACASEDECQLSDKESDWIDVDNDNNSSLLLNSEYVFRPDLTQAYQSQASLQVKANQSGAYICSATNDNITFVRKHLSFIVTGNHKMHPICRPTNGSIV